MASSRYYRTAFVCAILINTCWFLLIRSQSLASNRNNNKNHIKLPNVVSSDASNKHKAAGATTTTTNTTTSNGIEDLLHETFQSLDALEKKVASVGHRAPSAMMRGQLRLLQTTNEPPTNLSNAKPGIGNNNSNKPANNHDESSDAELALVKLAEAFSSDRKSSSQLSSDPLLNSESIIETGDQGMISQQQLPATNTADNNNNNHVIASRSNRQLVFDDGHTNGPYSYLPETDSTEQHIRFTLDLMQAIFTSQSYTSKTNLIESFLISPFSIQTVLMMMHLGARGQTRRELGQCLHLPPQSIETIAQSIDQPSMPQAANHQYKLKRRQQNAPAANGSVSSSTGASNKLPAPQNGRTTSMTAARPNRPGSAGASSAPTTNYVASSNVHELFGMAVKNLLKDSLVLKALTSANQIFLQKNLPLASHFEWALKHYYSADVKRVDFQNQSAGNHSLGHGHGSDSNNNNNNNSNNRRARSPDSAPPNSFVSQDSTSNDTDIQQMINDWIERQTKGRISNFLSSPVPQSTLLMAVNVLYLKGDWQYKFDVADTETDAIFTQANGETSRVPMMVNKLPLAFAHDAALKASVIELPYKAQRLGLFLLLPDEVNGIFHTMQHLNSTTFANLISAMKKQAPLPNETGSVGGINVRIPKFTIESTPRLSHILTQQLGIKTLFAPDVANLSGMFSTSANNSSSLGANKRSGDTGSSNSDQQQLSTPQVGLDEIIHKAVLQVDEHGSVAAASSATIVERVGLFNGNYFEADHPFLLFLMDKQTGLVLFSGVFAGPSSSSSSSSSSPASGSSSSSSPSNGGHGSNEASKPAANSTSSSE